ncbi:MAG: FAD binding domain-containing protein [Myxococcales bacterium]|nr:FAD binding domain-containing protein [Myxococcales bacterium]
MLRLPQFQVAAPETLEEVVEALRATPDARLIAGGTDILPNLKHKLEAPPRLITLGRVKALRGITRDDAAGVLRIGAGVRLATIASDPTVGALFPSLAKSAGLVASPTIRNMATIGGNVNLDVRCRYVNQTDFWREGIGGGCLKSEGDVCHVVPKGRNCVAAMSSDNVPVLISLDASLLLVGPSGEREVAMADYYRADGTNHTKAEPGELTAEVRIPLPKGPRKTDYVKWAVRKSIDFPLVSVALRVDLDGEGAEAPSEAKITDVRVVVGVLGARPREVKKLDGALGRTLADPEVAALVSEAAFKQCKPLPNVPYDPAYRRQMIRVYTRRALAAMAS